MASAGHQAEEGGLQVRAGEIVGGDVSSEMVDGDEVENAEREALRLFRT